MGPYAMLPTMIVTGLVGGYFLGYWLERSLGYEPWISFCGLILGGVASVRKVVQLVRIDEAKRNAEKKNSHRAGRG